MQKVTFVFVLFAVVVATLANHDHEPPKNNPQKPPGQSIEDQGHLENRIAYHRVARQLPVKMPSMDEMKHFAQEQISKLPQQMQEAIHKAQNMAQKMMQDQS